MLPFRGWADPACTLGSVLMGAALAAIGTIAPIATRKASERIMRSMEYTSGVRFDFRPACCHGSARRAQSHLRTWTGLRSRRIFSVVDFCHNVFKLNPRLFRWLSNISPAVVTAHRQPVTVRAT